MITQSRLKVLLHYCPDTGVFTRRTTINRHVLAGSVCMTIDSYDYIKIRVDGFRVRAHRLAFLYMLGYLPAEVDHVNGVRSDNSWANLRACTRSENQQNRCDARKDNGCGFIGVSFNSADGTYRARLQVNGVRTHLGHFPTAELAHAAYLKAKVKLHTHHERLLKHKEF